MVLRLSLRISMRSTDMSLSVERFCAPCAGDGSRGHLVCDCLVMRGGYFALGLETQLLRDSLRSRRDNRGDNLCRRLRRGLCRRPQSVCVLAGTFLGPHKQVFEAVVLRLSLRISMRSTDMSLSVERLCAPCAGDGSRGHLVYICLVVRGGYLALGLETQCERTALSGKNRTRGSNS